MADAGPNGEDEADEPRDSATGSDDAGGEAAADADTARDDDTETTADAEPTEGAESESVEALRERVEAEYDFENFGPQEMAEMSPDEWEAAFDADTWITGDSLLARVEADLRQRVAEREVFARVERFEDVLVAYSDRGYAAVYPDGTVEGKGTVLRDVKPTVALCSMESYDVPDAPAGQVLPDPDDIEEQGDSLGNTVMLAVGTVFLLAGLVLVGASLLYLLGVVPGAGGGARATNRALVFVAGAGFIVAALFIFFMVANARLSDRFRAEEYAERLRAVGLEDGERPAFLAEIDGIDEAELASTPTPGSGAGEADQPDGADGSGGE